MLRVREREGEASSCGSRSIARGRGAVKGSSATRCCLTRGLPHGEMRRTPHRREEKKGLLFLV